MRTLLNGGTMVSKSLDRATMKQHTFLLFALISLGSARSFGAEGFQYSVPPGFTVVPKDAPSTTLPGLPPELIKRVREFDTYAVALEEGAPVAELTVVIGEGSGTVLGSVESIASLGAKNPEFRVLSKSEVMLDDVSCGRIEFTAVVQGNTFQKLAYVMPLGRKRAWVALEATPAEFSLFRSEFEKSVSAVSGLSPANDPYTTARLVAFVSLGALIGVALRNTFGRRSKRRARSRTSA